jgi:hypothetical protein
MASASAGALFAAVVNVAVVSRMTRFQMRAMASASSGS